MVNAREPLATLLSIVMVVDRWADQASAIVGDVARRIENLVDDYEIILVDNGSDAASEDTYRAMTALDGQPNVQVYRLHRAVAYETAAWAGVEHSLGDMVLVFDPFNDALDPLAAAMREIVRRGREVVLIVNEEKLRESPPRAWLRRLYLRLFALVGGIDLVGEAAQYRLMTRRLVAYLQQQPQPAKAFRLIPATSGFARAGLFYRAPRRKSPRPSLWADMRRGVRLLYANSIAPVRIASLLGLTGAALNLLYSLYVVTLAFTRAHLQPGWVTLSLQQSGMFFLFSVLAVVLSEYLVESIRSGRSGAPYFVVEEMSSAMLTARHRLNVETGGSMAGRGARKRP